MIRALCFLVQGESKVFMTEINIKKKQWLHPQKTQLEDGGDEWP